MALNKKIDIEKTGIRQKTGNGDVEYPFHMTSVLKKLFPGIEWIQDEPIKDFHGNYLKTPKGGTYFPDFRNNDLKIIIEID